MIHVSNHGIKGVDCAVEKCAWQSQEDEVEEGCHQNLSGFSVRVSIAADAICSSVRDDVSLLTRNERFSLATSGLLSRAPFISRADAMRNLIDMTVERRNPGYNKPYYPFKVECQNEGVAVKNRSNGEGKVKILRYVYFQVHPLI